jgi:hypothetical protein
MLPIAPNPAQNSLRQIEGLGPGATLQPGATFLVKAYGEVEAKSVSAMVEGDYQRLVADTGLFSFKPGGLYPVTVYKNAGEYLAKTRAPEWSGGFAVGNAIFTYRSPQLPGTLAHEITHVIFQEYMGTADRLRWLNEGLAVYEELQAAGTEERGEIETWMAEAKKDPIPFSDMVTYIPNEGAKVRRWYGQVALVVRYLVETGGRGGVARLMQETKQGTPLDTALAASFPTLCGDLSSLERRWLNRN